MIKILSLPNFLATKFSAFKSRGGKAPRMSHDFEGIVYLLNHTSKTKALILVAEKRVQLFLKGTFLEILADDRQQEAIIGNLYYEEQMERFKKIIGELKAIIQAI